MTKTTNWSHGIEILLLIRMTRHLIFVGAVNLSDPFDRNTVMIAIDAFLNSIIIVQWSVIVLEAGTIDILSYFYFSKALLCCGVFN